MVFFSFKIKILLKTFLLETKGVKRLMFSMFAVQQHKGLHTRTGAYPGIKFVNGGGGGGGEGALLEIFSKVGKKSIFISLTYNRGQVYVRTLLAYSYEHIARQYIIMSTTVH